MTPTRAPINLSQLLSVHQKHRLLNARYASKENLYQYDLL